MTWIAGAAGGPATALEERLVALSGGAGSPRRIHLGSSSGLAVAATPEAHIDGAQALAWVGSRPLRNGAAGFRARSDCSAVAMGGASELLLVRGPFGGRPLYYARDGASSAVVAGSRLGGIATAVGRRVPNADWLSSYVMDDPLVDQTATPYDAVARVPSSTTLRIRPEGLMDRDVMPFPSQPWRKAPIQVLAAELREHIIAAVRRAMPEREDVGVLVSGGLDSSGILAAALRVAGERGQRVQVFNLDFAGQGDDRPHLAALCRMYGLEPVRMRPSDCSTSLRDTLVVDETPIENPIGALMARFLRRHGVKHLLTGEGGDDVFGGDERVFADRVLSGHPVDALRQAARLRAWGRHKAWARVRTLVIRPIVLRALPRRLAGLRAARRRRFWPAWAGPRLIKILSTGVALPYDLRWEERTTDSSWLEHRSTATYYLDCSAARAQMEEVGGFLRSDPILDGEVVDFVASLAPEILFHGGWVRGLYREALEGWVPETLRRRPDKANFETALVEFAGGRQGLEDLSDLASCERLADLGVVEPRPFKERFDRLVNDPSDGVLWLEVLRVLSAEAFVRGQTAGSS